VQKAVSDRTGHPLNDWVSIGDDLPERSQPDRVFIVGDCDLMLVGTGDLFAPWVPIAMRTIHLEVEIGDQASNGTAVVVGFRNNSASTVAVEISDYHYRIVATRSSGQMVQSEWRPATPGVSMAIDIYEDFDHGRMIVDAPGQLRTTLDFVERRQDAIARISIVEPAISEADHRRLDLSLDVTKGNASTLCEQLLSDHS